MADALMEAAINKDTTDLEAKLASLTEGDGVLWLHRACQDNSADFVWEVIRLKPSLAWRKNQDGLYAIHIACQNGQGDIVKALTESSPDGTNQYSLRDGRNYTPLHIAAESGHIQVVKTILEACPELLAEVTILGETALHLAAKTGQIGAFEVLMEETLKYKREKILQMKDYEGNNFFHIAVLHKRLQILKWLVVDNPTYHHVVRVNSTNGRGLTALDIHCQNFTEHSDGAIRQLLHQVGARRGQPAPDNNNNNNFSKLSVLLTASTLIAGSAYTSLFNLSSNPGGTNALRVRDIILHPYLLPDGFYNIMLMTVAFTLSMIGIVVPLWPMIKEWSFSLRSLPFLGLGAFFFSYAFTVKEKVPKFWVTTGPFKISSFWLVWLYAQPLIPILVIIIWLVVKQNHKLLLSFAN